MPVYTPTPDEGFLGEKHTLSFENTVQGIVCFLPAGSSTII